MIRRWEFWLVLGFAGWLLFARLDQRPLWASHEARAAQNAASLHDGSAVVVPQLFDGQPELQKPPAYYWLISWCAELTGDVDALSVRLPAAFAGWLTVVAVYVFLFQRNRPTTAVIAALVLVTTIRFTASARVARIDMPLTAMITIGLLIWFARGLEAPSITRVVTSSLCIAFAVLLKGPIGFVLAATVLLMVYLVERRRPPWRSLFLSLFLISVASIPWFLQADRVTDGEFTRTFFWYHNFQRAMGGAEALAGYPWWYYLPRFTIDALPWTPFIWLAFRGGDAESRLGAVWVVTMVIVLSCARFKRADYLLPAFPGFAILVSGGIERWYRSCTVARRGWLRGGCVTMVMGCAFGWWSYDRWITPTETARHDPTAFAEVVRGHAPGEEILLFRVESHLLAWELGRPLLTRVEWHHLNQWLEPPGTHYFVVPPEYVNECLQNVWTKPIEVVSRSERFCPSLRRPFVLMRNK